MINVTAPPIGHPPVVVAILAHPHYRMRRKASTGRWCRRFDTGVYDRQQGILVGPPTLPPLVRSVEGLPAERTQHGQIDTETPISERCVDRDTEGAKRSAHRGAGIVGPTWRQVLNELQVIVR